MKDVRTVIWDLDETMWFYNENEPKVLCEKLNIDDVVIFEKQYYGMWEGLGEHFQDTIVNYERVKQYISKKITILELYAATPEDLIGAIRDEKKKFVTLNQEAIEMIKYFSEKGYKNISVTDWLTKDQEHALESFNLRSYVQEVYGFDNDYLKSAVRKKERIVKNVIADKPGEFVIIGDSLSSDIFFANNIGIKSIWYNRKCKVNETVNIPTLEVKSLLELKEIL